MKRYLPIIQNELSSFGTLWRCKKILDHPKFPDILYDTIIILADLLLNRDPREAGLIKMDLVYIFKRYRPDCETLADKLQKSPFFIPKEPSQHYLSNIMLHIASVVTQCYSFDYLYSLNTENLATKHFLYAFNIHDLNQALFILHDDKIVDAKILKVKAVQFVLETIAKDNISEKVKAIQFILKTIAKDDISKEVRAKILKMKIVQFVLEYIAKDDILKEDLDKLSKADFDCSQQDVIRDLFLQDREKNRDKITTCKQALSNEVEEAVIGLNSLPQIVRRIKKDRCYDCSNAFGTFTLNRNATLPQKYSQFNTRFIDILKGEEPDDATLFISSLHRKIGYFDIKENNQDILSIIFLYNLEFFSQLLTHPLGVELFVNNLKFLAVKKDELDFSFSESEDESEEQSESRSDRDFSSYESEIKAETTSHSSYKRETSEHYAEFLPRNKRSNIERTFFTPFAKSNVQEHTETQFCSESYDRTAELIKSTRNSNKIKTSKQPKTDLPKNGLSFIKFAKEQDKEQN